MSVWYDEDVGSHAKPTQWDEAELVECPNCHEPAGTRCVFPDGSRRKFPCVRRIVAGRKVVSA